MPRPSLRTTAITPTHVADGIGQGEVSDAKPSSSPVSESCTVPATNTIVRTHDDRGGRLLAEQQDGESLRDEREQVVERGHRAPTLDGE